jgi:microcystin-dependent protein
MVKPYIGEIRLFACTTIPAGWLPCDGRSMQAGPNPLLFQAIKYAFGGFGANFNLPDLSGRVPLHYNNAYAFASKGGEAQHTLAVTELPPHSHFLLASSQPGTTVIPNGQMLARAPDATPFYHGAAQANVVAMDANQVGPTGGGGAHENMAPYLPLQFCIATDFV